MLTLGVDLGTTKVAAVLYDPDASGAGRAVSTEHHAALPAAPGHAEQDGEKMYAAVLRLLAELPPRELGRVEAVGLTGQMHSVILWSGGELSPAVTWQDKRASAAGHLDEFRTLSGRPLADGFGAVTLAELARQGELERWRYAASPADWLATRLTGNPAPVTDPTFAASWGIFDSASGGWDLKAAAALGIPPGLLPPVVASSSIVGTTCRVSRTESPSPRRSATTRLRWSALPWSWTGNFS